MTLTAAFLQLVPYVGEDLVSVRVEPCSPTVSQERQEVLEVGVLLCKALLTLGCPTKGLNLRN